MLKYSRYETFLGIANALQKANRLTLFSLGLLAPLFPHNDLDILAFLLGNLPTILLWLLTDSYESDLIYTT